MTLTDFIKTPAALYVDDREAVCGGVHEIDHSTTDPHEIRKSNPSLAFFEFRGEGSPMTKVCEGCHFMQSGHDVYGITFAGEHTFTEHGAWEYDSFYCGHNGWD